MTTTASRRHIFAAAAAATALTAAKAAAQPPACHVGPPPHPQGPNVFLDYDQVALDAAYFQPAYEPSFLEVNRRASTNSDITRARLGAPLRRDYGPGATEKLDIFRTKQANAPVFIFIHGGAWRAGTAADYAFIAEAFVAAGTHYVAPDFDWVQNAGGDLTTLADQVRRSVAWVYRNAASFGGDPTRIYLGGHSSGGHLAAVALTTDWQPDFALPADIVKGGICLSGIYDLTPVRLSSRSTYIKFDDAMVAALSPIRHLDRLTAPLIVVYGSKETPEFQRQNQAFAAAVKAKGKLLELVTAENYYHLEIAETLANPYGAAGYPTLRMLQRSA